MKVAGSLETLVTVCQILRRHIPENHNLIFESYEKFECYKIYIIVQRLQIRGPGP